MFAAGRHPEDNGDNGEDDEDDRQRGEDLSRHEPVIICNKDLNQSRLLSSQEKNLALSILLEKEFHVFILSTQGF